MLEEVIIILCQEKPLPPKNNDHALIGDYLGDRECHITPDWLLIYKIEKDILTLLLTRTRYSQRFVLIAYSSLESLNFKELGKCLS